MFDAAGFSAAEVCNSPFEQKFRKTPARSPYNSTLDFKYLANQYWSSNQALYSVPLLIIMPGSDHDVGGASRSKSSSSIVPNYSFPSRAALSFPPPSLFSSPLSLPFSPFIHLPIWRRNLTAPYGCQRWRGSDRFVLTTTLTLMRLCPCGSALFVA